MWIDEKLDEVSNVLRNEANVAATKVSAAAMCEEKVSAAYFDLVVGELELLTKARRLVAAAAVAVAPARGGGRRAAAGRTAEAPAEAREAARTRRGGSSARCTPR